jgi:putative FmdB family regulatory protein
MPLYDFGCAGCGTTVEVLRSMDSTAEERCPQCGRAMEKVVSRPAEFRNLRPRAPGKTCCGRDERCESPPCGPGGSCCK